MSHNATTLRGICLAASLLLMGLLFSCSKSTNSLRGSVSQLFSLDFQTVDIQSIPGESLAIVYASPIKDSVEKEQAAKILLDTTKFTIETGVAIDLVKYAQLSRFRLVTTNNVPTEDRDPFPAIEYGSLTFSKYSEITGDPIAGSFQIVFISGDTLLGEFESSLQ